MFAATKPRCSRIAKQSVKHNSLVAVGSSSGLKANVITTIISSVDATGWGLDYRKISLGNFDTKCTIEVTSPKNGSRVFADCQYDC